MRKRLRSCLGCLGTLVVLFVLVMAARSQPTLTVTLPTPTPAFTTIDEWAHWQQASATLRFDTAAVWVRRAYPDTSNADLVRLAREMVACMDAAGTAAPLADTGAACLLLLKPN